jgi:hypothetical protein
VFFFKKFTVFKGTPRIGGVIFERMKNKKERKEIQKLLNKTDKLI